MRDKLEAIKAEALAKIESAEVVSTLNDVKVAILGKKGELTQVLKSMKDVAPEDRPKVGQMVNEARQAIETALDEKTKSINRALRAEKMKRETIDVTLPGVKKLTGHRHPNQIALEDLERVFIGMGYEIVEGPEVEYDKYNFELLNIPANHPARMSRIHSMLQRISSFVHRHHLFRQESWRRAIFRSESSHLDEYSELMR